MAGLSDLAGFLSCSCSSTTGGATPRRLGLTPVSAPPELNHLVRAKSDTRGRVNRKATSTSMIVVKPSTKAKPRTLPTEMKYRIAAASSDTKSAARIVFRARTQPVSAAERRVRPSRISSRMRSKYTTKESAVIPIATIAPATPASVSASPIVRPRMTKMA